jgi:putative BNR repeat neuraminidase
MTGQTERRVTYPQFVSAPNGELYFFYRDGASGNGNFCLNRYDPATKSWKVVHHPLIDGLNRCNPYWWRPAVAPDGAIHLAWCWRQSPDAESNQDLCYATSHDGGQTWLRSDGANQNLPITPDNAEVVIPISQGSNLINQCSSAVDAQGHPHFTQYMNDPAGIPQYFHTWFDGAHWQNNQISHRKQKFSLNGAGSLAIPISRPEIAISKTSTVYLISRDAEFGGGIRLYRSAAPYNDWTAIDLTHDDLGEWEPSYDLNRWSRDGILSLFVLTAHQGNHERTTDFPPQTAAILETKLP